jgi:hypothetical protein
VGFHTLAYSGSIVSVALIGQPRHEDARAYTRSGVLSKSVEDARRAPIRKCETHVHSPHVFDSGLAQKIGIINLILGLSNTDTETWVPPHCGLSV